MEDQRLNYLYNRYTEYKYQLKRNVLSEDEFYEHIEAINKEAVEMWGSKEPLYDYIKKQILSSSKAININK